MLTQRVSFIIYIYSIGFNWIQEVLWHLHNLDTLNIPVSEKEVLACRVPFLEHLFKTQDPRSLVNFPSPRLLKTHLSYRYWADNLHPVKDKLKVILWVAEPKDTIANYYRFWSTKGKFFDFPEIEWNYFFDLFKRDKLFEGNWYETNISWLKAYENDPRMLVLSYEQTRSDPRGCVSKMADFLEIVVTDEELKKLVSVVEFDKWPDWSTVYNIEQKQYIDHLTRTKLVGTPLEHLYPCDIGII